MDSFDGSGTANAFPHSFDYPEGVGELRERYVNQILSSAKPKILIMGLKRSGKSSIQKVVFHKMAPNETLFLESTNKIVKDEISNNSFICFSIWDFPSGHFEDLETEYNMKQIFDGCGALVFVIDSQDDYGEALTTLNQTIRKAHQINPNLNFEVFIHKVDGLSDDHKIEARQEIHQRAIEDLNENDENILLSFYLTSIYDHSIFEAFSKVVQKLIPQMATLENLLNVYISSSGIEKAFLFDVVSKIFIATDSSPVDMQSYELCCDMIDVVIDISCIYGVNDQGEPCTFDKRSSASIRLNSGTVLYLREVNKFLALVCILREENFSKQGMIDYNFHCFRQSIQEVFAGKFTNKNQMFHIHPEDMADSSCSSFSNQYNGDGDEEPVNNDIDPGSFENESLLLRKRTSTPIINSPTNSTSAATSYTQSPNQPAPISNQIFRKSVILPATTIPSSLPNHTAIHSNSVASKSKLHSPNILNNGPLTQGYFKSSYQ